MLFLNQIEHSKLRNSYEGRDLRRVYLVIQFLPHREHVRLHYNTYQIMLFRENFVLL
jgi:hypothetical protein